MDVIQGRIENVLASKGKSICLSSLKLEQIPDEVFMLEWLTDLDLSENQITCIPASIKKLSSLQRLNLNHNCITEIPKELLEMPALTSICLAFNNNLPVELSREHHNDFGALSNHLSWGQQTTNDPFVQMQRLQPVPNRENEHSTNIYEELEAIQRQLENEISSLNRLKEHSPVHVMEEEGAQTRQLECRLTGSPAGSYTDLLSSLKDMEHSSNRKDFLIIEKRPRHYTFSEGHEFEESSDRSEDKTEDWDDGNKDFRKRPIQHSQLKQVDDFNEESEDDDFDVDEEEEEEEVEDEERNSTSTRKSDPPQEKSGQPNLIITTSGLLETLHLENVASVTSEIQQSHSQNQSLNKILAPHSPKEDTKEAELSNLSHVAKLSSQFYGKSFDLKDQLLLKEGLLVLHRKDLREFCHVFLFSKSIVITEKKSFAVGGKTAHKGIPSGADLTQLHYKVIKQELIQNLQPLNQQDENDQSPIFIVMTNKRKYTFSAKTFKEKQQWVEDLTKAMKGSLNEESSSKPLQEAGNTSTSPLDKSNKKTVTTRRRSSSLYEEERLIPRSKKKAVFGAPKMTNWWGIRKKDKQGRRPSTVFEENESTEEEISSSYSNMTNSDTSPPPSPCPSPAVGREKDVEKKSLRLDKSSSIRLDSSGKTKHDKHRNECSKSPVSRGRQNTATSTRDQCSKSPTRIPPYRVQSLIKLNESRIRDLNLKDSNSAAGEPAEPLQNSGFGDLHPVVTPRDALTTSEVGTEAIEAIILLPDDPNLEDKQRKRNMCINEIITTERDYIVDIEYLSKTFREPIRDGKILSDAEISHIFSNITLLLGVNRQLFKELQTQLSSPTPPTIGAPFLQLVDYLKMYQTYCSNQQTALETVRTCAKENTVFRDFLNQRFASADSGVFCLRSYLIKPVQRICKYPLLLRELIKFTSPNHPDYVMLTDALKRMQGVVGAIEDKSQKVENLQKMIEIQSRFEHGEKLILVTPSRWFIKEGVFRDIHDNEEVFVFLFTDMLLIGTLSTADTKKKKGMFVLSNVKKMIQNKQPEATTQTKRLHKLKQIQLSGVLSINTNPSVPDLSPDDQLKVFAIEFLESGEAMKQVLVASSVEEKKDWVNEIQTVVQTALQAALQKAKGAPSQ